MADNSNSAESSNTGASRVAWLNHVNSQSQRHIFVYARCKKTFPTTYALGGHQNAHKRERNEERRVYMEERRLKAMEETTVLSPPPLSQRNQIIDYLAKPRAAHAGLTFDDEFVEEKMVHMYDQIQISHSAMGHGDDEMNYHYYLKYVYGKPKLRPQEQDLCKKKELIALSFEQEGVWIKECLPVLHVTEKSETSRTLNGGFYEAEFTSNGVLDLTLKL